MNKHSNLSKFFKKFSFLISNLYIKNKKKLNFNEKKFFISRFISAKRVFAACIVLVILCFSYLSIPIFYNKSKIENEIKNQLLKDYNINFKSSNNIKYGIFPRPNYKFKNIQIFNNKNKKFANVEILRINLKITNFFFKKKLNIKEVLFKNAKFNMNEKNFDFFFNLLESDFSKSNIKISDSYIFFKNDQDEVLLINKIKQMNYYYDKKKIQNILTVKNEIFNIPYYLEFYNDKDKKKIFSKININILKSSFESEYDYRKNIKKGLINIKNDKNKSQIDFTLTKERLIFELSDKMNEENFKYDGEINLKPFYLDFSGKLKKISLNHFINSNSVLLQLLKTETLNNQNLNITSTIKSKKIIPYQKLINFLLNVRIKEGLIDIDDSNFSWSNFADFEISESLIYLNNNNLALDGKMKIKLKNYDEIYKFFQTPRNHRKEIKDLEFFFNYNFDQEIINISELKIDNQSNEKVGEILKNLVTQENVLQNRIYLKNLINKAIKAYSG